MVMGTLLRRSPRHSPRFSLLSEPSALTRYSAITPIVYFHGDGERCCPPPAPPHRRFTRYSLCFVRKAGDWVTVSLSYDMMYAQHRQYIPGYFFCLTELSLRAKGSRPVDCSNKRDCREGHKGLLSSQTTIRQSLKGAQCIRV